MRLTVFKMHYLCLLVSVSFGLRNRTNKCAFKVVSLSSVTTRLDKQTPFKAKWLELSCHIFILLKIFSSAHTTSEQQQLLRP